MEEKLAQYLYENTDILRVTDSYIFRQGGVKVHRSKYCREELKYGLLKKAGVADLLDGGESEIKVVKSKAIDLLGQYLEEDKNEKLQDKFGWDEENRPDPSIFKPIVNIKTNARVLYNKVTQNISNVSPEVWEGLLTAEEKKMINSLYTHALVEYDPYDLTKERKVEFEGMILPRINIYNAPKWRERWENGPQESVECPPLAKKLFEHLFPDEECLEYVLHWIYTMIKKRNETYLVLNGAKGIGKGVLASLLSGLVGREHSTETPVSFMSSDFNSVLNNKRLIIMDEAKVCDKHYYKLKRYANKFQNIEMKGVDADSARETFHSFIVLNNDLTDMYLESDDRRFSVPEVTDLPLRKSMRSEEIEQLVRLAETEDEDFFYDLGGWILNNCSSQKYDEFTVWAREKYHALVFVSLKEWQKYIVTTVTEGMDIEYSLSMIRRAFEKSEKNAKFPRHVNRVRGFLDKYTHRGERLATIEQRGREYFIIPSETFMPSEDVDVDDIL